MIRTRVWPRWSHQLRMGIVVVSSIHHHHPLMVQHPLVLLHLMHLLLRHLLCRVGLVMVGHLLVHIHTLLVHVVHLVHVVWHHVTSGSLGHSIHLLVKGASRYIRTHSH